MSSHREQSDVGKAVIY